MKNIRILAAIAMLSACSARVVPTYDLTISYSKGNVESVLKELDSYDRTDRMVAFPVSVNAYIRSYLDNGLEHSLKEAGRINEDFYLNMVDSEIKARDSASYKALINEWESGVPSKFADICSNMHGFDVDHPDAECDCREVLVDEGLTNIGVGPGYPNAERALWITKSSENICEIKNIPWTLVSSLLKYDLYGGDKDGLSEVLRSQNLQANKLAADWLCGLKDRYPLYDESSLGILVNEGLIECSH